MKSPRNKTINIPVEEGGAYLERCAAVTKPAGLNDIINKTILGDTLEVMPLLPRGFADLIIVDPPYNLDKDFNGNRFKSSGDDEYTRYTAKWLDLVEPLLKPTGSMYVCCDWRSGMVIGNLLQQRFKLRNRITWQREGVTEFDFVIRRASPIEYTDVKAFADRFPEIVSFSYSPLTTTHLI